MSITGFAAFACVFVISDISVQGFSGFKIIRRTLNECTKVNESYSCISDKVGRAIERSMNWDVPLVDGIMLIRNSEKINDRQARMLGSDRLKQAAINFLDTHVISLEFGGARRRGKAIGGGGFMNRKGMRRQKKYMAYAFMLLLGIFGLTGPLIMKTLAIMATKALLAAKAAFIIVGSIALKKLFEKDYQEPVIKVHTVDHGHDDDEYDRISNYGHMGYGGSSTVQSYNNPYSSYYDDYYANSLTKNSAKVK